VLLIRLRFFAMSTRQLRLATSSSVRGFPIARDGWSNSPSTEILSVCSLRSWSSEVVAIRAKLTPIFFMTLTISSSSPLLKLSYTMLCNKSCASRGFMLSLSILTKVSELLAMMLYPLAILAIVSTSSSSYNAKIRVPLSSTIPSSSGFFKWIFTIPDQAFVLV
jgi:hypothetical protein